MFSATEFLQKGQKKLNIHRIREGQQQHKGTASIHSGTLALHM